MGAGRSRIAFRSVNRKDAPGYQPGMQRHHLLPRQLLAAHCFGPLFDCLGRERLGFDDFRANGLLLPARDEAAMRFGLPLHRGPHRSYNQLVAERVGQVEAAWSARRRRVPEIALDEAIMRLSLLQCALRKRLLSPEKRLKLNRNDPLGAGLDFSGLDAMVEMLWGGTQVIANVN
jgi:hypothetical protein